MSALSFHPAQVADLLVAAVLLWFGLVRWRQGRRQLGGTCVGAALALFGLFTEVIGFSVGHHATFGNAQLSVEFWAGPAELKLFTLRSEAVERFPWFPDSLHWSALVLTTALGAGAGLAFALKVEHDEQQREESRRDGAGEEEVSGSKFPIRS